MNKKTELKDTIDEFFHNIPEKYLDFIKNSDIADEGKIGYKEWLESLPDVSKAKYVYLALGLTQPPEMGDTRHKLYKILLYVKNYQEKHTNYFNTSHPDYKKYQDELLKLYLEEHRTHIRYKNIYECCKFDTTTANKENVRIIRNGIMGCSEDRLKDALNTNDLSDFDSFFVQQLSKLQEAIKDMHKDGYFLDMIQNNRIYLNKKRTEYLDFDIMFMLLDPDELIDFYELEKNKKPLVGDEYNYSNSKQRVEAWLDKSKPFLPKIERRSASVNDTSHKEYTKLPSIKSAENNQKKNLSPQTNYK